MELPFSRSRSSSFLVLPLAAGMAAASCAAGEGPPAGAGGAGGHPTSTSTSTSTDTGGATSTTSAGTAGSDAGTEAGPAPASCADVIDITSAVAGGGQYHGAASGQSVDASSCSNQAAPKSYLKFSAAMRGNYQVQVSSSAPGAPDPSSAALAIRGHCAQPGTELTCSTTPAFLPVLVGIAEPGDVYLVLDGAWFAPGYTLTVTPSLDCLGDMDCDLFSPQTQCLTATGVCTSPYTCPFGFADCNGNPGDGCEANLTADPQNCGACGESCAALPNVANASCEYGCVYSCLPGHGDCDGKTTNGCEQDLLADVHNCGGCGNDCTKNAQVSSATCVAGQCVNACNPGFGDCDGYGGNGCESRFSDDPAHCGACAGDCHGGGCAAGVCLSPPTTLATGLQRPFGIAVDTTNVYFGDSKANTISSVPLAGGPVVTLATTPLPPSYVGVDGGQVYYAIESWSDAATGLYRVPVGGGAPTPVALGYYDLSAFAMSPGYAFFKSVRQGSSTQALRKVELATGTVTDLVVLSSWDAYGGVTADATYVYWTDTSALEVRRVPIAGGPSVVLVNGLMGEPAGIAVDAASIYWVNADDYTNGAWMAPLAGGTEVSLSPTEPASFSPTLGPGPVALAGGFLYYINNAADWIRKVPVGGGAVSSVAGEQSGLGQLAVDATSVYWTSQGIPGTVMKAPR